MNRTIVCNPEIYHRCYYQGNLELLHWKILKITRKTMYVIEFPFTKIVRIHSTAYYRLKKSTTDWLDLQIASLQVTALALPSMFAKFWKILEITCVVEFIFYRSRPYQVHYQRSIHAVLIMSVLQRKTEFYKGGVIVKRS